MKVERTKVDDLATVVTKGTTPTTLGYDYVSDGVRFLRAQNINNGEVIFNDDDLFISSETNELLKRSIIQPGDVLLSIAGTVGRSAVVPKDVPNLNCNQAVAIIRLNSKILPGFFRHWLDSTDAQRQMSGASVTMTISNLSLTQIKNLQIPLPPLAEQQRIAAILDKADALRAQRRAALAKLDTLLQSTFLHLFGDPVTNPMRWEVVKLGEIINDLRYGTGSPPGYTETGIPFIRATNIKNGTVVENDLRYIPQDEADKISKCKLKTGDLIVVRSGVNSGDCAIIPEQYNNAYAGYDIIVELPFNWAVFANHFINSPQGQHIIKPMTRRAGQPHLNADQIKSIGLIKPTPRKLEQFKDFWKKIEHMKQIHLVGLQELDNLFHALQQRAFNGQLSM